MHTIIPAKMEFCVKRIIFPFSCDTVFPGFTLGTFGVLTACIAVLLLIFFFSMPNSGIGSFMINSVVHYFTVVTFGVPTACIALLLIIIFAMPNSGYRFFYGKIF